MKTKATHWIFLMAAALFASCVVTVPMASSEQDAESKKFIAPSDDQAGLYVYREASWAGQGVEKIIYLDGLQIGSVVNGVFLHRLIASGPHKLGTESEFGRNTLEFMAMAGRNYFFEHYSKTGVFISGALLREVSEEEGKKKVLECGEAYGVAAMPPHP
jgi:hypothetical protein